MDHSQYATRDFCKPLLKGFQPENETATSHFLRKAGYEIKPHPFESDRRMIAIAGLVRTKVFS